MLTIERSEKVSITTGNDVLKDVAGGDPIIGEESPPATIQRGHHRPWCLSVHSLRSFR